MRKEILLVVCFGILFASIFSLGVVSAGGNTTTVEVNSPIFGITNVNANFSSTIILNLSFTNDTDLIVPENASSGIDWDVINISFWGLSSNSTWFHIGSTNNCWNNTAGATNFSCWDSFDINSTMDGLWTIYANYTNATHNTDLEFFTDSNATAILFDSTPPQVTTFVTATGLNYSGVLFTLNATFNDSDNLRADGSNSLDNVSVRYSGVEEGGLFFNITNSAGTMNVSYYLTALGNGTNNSDYHAWYEINTSHLGTSDTYTVTIWVNDSLNNINNSETITFVYDGESPVATVTKDSNSTYYSLSGTLAFTGATSGISSCTVDRSGASVVRR